MFMLVDAGQRHFQNGPFAGWSAFLRQMAHRNIFIARNRPFVRFLRPEDKREQSGFARAIGTDQPDAVRAINLQRHVLK